MRPDPNLFMFPSETDQLKSDLSRLNFEFLTEKSGREYDRMLATYQVQTLQIELDYAKSRLDQTVKALEGREYELHCAANHLTVMENRLKSAQGDHKHDVTKLKQAREKDRKKFLEERGKDQEMVNWLKKDNEKLTDQVNTLMNGGVVVQKGIQMPMCEICAREYTECPFMTPRMLCCGHTLCEECAGMISTKKTLKCPFDRKITKLTNGVNNLPKNFTIVQMMSRR